MMTTTTMMMMIDLRLDTSTTTQPARPRAEITAFVAVELILIAAAAATVGWLGWRADLYPVESYFYLAKATSVATGGWLALPWNDGFDRHCLWAYSLALALPLQVFRDAAFWMLSAGLVAWTGVVWARILGMLPLTNASRAVALALALFNPVTLQWASVPAPEPLLLALAVTAVYFGMRYREGAAGRELLWAALFSGLCMATKPEGFAVAAVLGALCAARLRRERRSTLTGTVLILLLAPEALHLAYLAWHALPVRGPVAYLDAVGRWLRGFNPLATVMVHLRAPFWQVFRFDTEPWLYARLFPGWLPVAQGLVVVFYLAMLAFALVSGFFHRGFGFATAVGLVVAAALHRHWAASPERLDYLSVPAAALVLAWSIDGTVAWLRRRPRARAAVTLAVGLGCAAVSGLYGSRAAQLHVTRLKLLDGERDAATYKTIAASVNLNNPKQRPVVTDLGPRLAYRLEGHAWFDRAEPGLYDDAVPMGENARAFLVEKGIAAVVSTRSESQLERELGLTGADYQRVPALGATILVLDLAEGR